MIGNFWGYFEKLYAYVQTALASFWATFGKKLGYFLLQHLVTLLEDVYLYVFVLVVSTICDWEASVLGTKVLIDNSYRKEKQASTHSLDRSKLVVLLATEMTRPTPWNFRKNQAAAVAAVLLLTEMI